MSYEITIIFLMELEAMLIELDKKLIGQEFCRNKKKILYKTKALSFYKNECLENKTIEMSTG